MSLYDILGVKRDADSQAIKSAWRKKASKAHPDRKGGSEEAFKQIQLAYDTLSDPSKRDRYDRTGDTERPRATPATTIVISVLNSLITNPNFRGDYIVGARGIIHKNESNASAFIESTNTEILRLEKTLKRVKAKGSENLFESIITEKLQTLRNKVETAQADLVQMAEAIQMLQNYEDVAPDRDDPYPDFRKQAIMAKFGDMGGPFDPGP